MAGLSDDQANGMLDTLYGGVATIAPAIYYHGLSTTEPASDGTNVTEPVGNGYARVAVTNNLTNFPAAALRSKSNGTVITFPAPTPGDWGVVEWVPLYDAATSGNFCGWGVLASPVTVTGGGSAPEIPVGGMVYNAPVT